MTTQKRKGPRSFPIAALEVFSAYRLPVLGHRKGDVALQRRDGVDVRSDAAVTVVLVMDRRLLVQEIPDIEGKIEVLQVRIVRKHHSGAVLEVEVNRVE